MERNSNKKSFLQGVGFLGLGKLGLPCAAALSVATKTKVVGYDKNEAVKGFITSGTVPYVEDSIEHYLQEAKLEFVNSVEEVIKSSSLVFCAIQTPHEELYEGNTPTPQERKDFDYSFLESLMYELRLALEQNPSQEITLVVISTVLPGTMRSRILPILFPVRSQIRFCYNPFFIAMGTTIRDFLDPEFILIGSDDERQSKDLVNLYQSFSRAPIRRMSIESAELTKVAYNTFIGFKIVFANSLGEICDQTGGNVDEVTDALAAANTRLMSGKYLSSGMGDGGGCHPRDQIAMSWLARKIQMSVDPFTWLAKARDAQTQKQAFMIAELKRQNPYLAVVILGEAYKANINLTVGSPSRLLQYYCKELGIEYKVLDPHVYPDIEWNLTAAIYFIATNHENFKRTIFPSESIVIDPWGSVVTSSLQPSSVRILRPGRN